MLDGAVRLAATDQHRLGLALLPVLRRHRAHLAERNLDPLDLFGMLGNVMHAAADLRAAGARRGWWATRLTEARRLLVGAGQLDHRIPVPQRILRARLAEIGDQIGPASVALPRPPGLLAAPTHANGAIDPGVLYERLAALGPAAPWTWDFEQALLRLPTTPQRPATETEPATAIEPVAETELVTETELVAAAAAALGSPAGDRLAAWLRAGGLPTPVYQMVTVDRGPRPQRYGWQQDRLPERRVGVTALPPTGTPDQVRLLTVPAWPLDQVFRPWSDLWPAMLPGYRGLVAAYLLPDIAASTDCDLRGGAGLLPLLAECTGGSSPAVDLAVAYGLGARHTADQVATVDALLALASNGGCDAPAIGTQVGALAEAGLLLVSRLVGPLRDAAAAGASATTFQLLASALPSLLAAPVPPRGTPDLLNLAAELAIRTGATAGPPDRPTIAGLAGVAARRGSSRLMVEARRLDRALTR